MKYQKDDNEQAPFTPWDEFAFESYQALLKDRTILFNGEVKDNIIERVALPLITLAQKNTKPIKLIINSPGGQVEAGQAVVDAILTSRAPVITIAMGQAMSAAFDIYLAGSFRICYPNTILMCHSGSAKLEAMTLPQINQEAKLHYQYFQRWSRWYASRTKISEKDWMDLLNSGLNRYWHPEQAFKDGLVNKILPVVNKPLKNLLKFKF